MKRRLIPLFLLLSFCATLQAHVGSPDIYLDAKAGPYQLFITVRPPTVIPGVAELEIRSETPGISEVRAVPMPMSGPGARFAPLPDTLKVSPRDPQFFTGALWMMASGSWQVKVSVEGKDGRGTVAVPVPSVALSTKKMQTGLGAMLSVLMGFLVLGAVAIVGASVREAELLPGDVPDPRRKRRGQIAMAVAFTVTLGVLAYGYAWWSSEAAAYSGKIYKPMQMSAVVDGSGVLTLSLQDAGVLPVRTSTDLVPDHDHLMHLYVLREPGLDVVYHLHPEQTDDGHFRLILPSMPAGNYKLYADIVHQNGFPETLVSSITMADHKGRPLSGDDASGTAAAWSRSPATATEFTLPDGYHMEWLNGDKPLHAREPQLFRFRLTDGKNQTPADMALYMGMLGHAAFVKTDGTVFAHIHPTGSVSMAAYMQAQGNSTGMGDMPGMDMSSGEHSEKLPNEVAFPYGLPTAGRYRIIVQMKHGSTVETGIFDTQVN